MHSNGKQLNNSTVEVGALRVGAGLREPPMGTTDNILFPKVFKFIIDGNFYI
jgi:hypothetical protein